MSNTLKNSMDELMDFAKGKANDVKVEFVGLVTDRNKVILTVTGSNTMLNELEKENNKQDVRQGKKDRGDGYGDYTLFIEEEPRVFIFALAEKFPKLWFKFQYKDKTGIGYGEFTSRSK